MRFIYTLLLGLIIFQAMIIIVSPFFPSTTYESQTTNISELEKYGNLSSSEEFLEDTFRFSLTDPSQSGQAFGTAAAIFLVSLSAGVLSRNLPIFLGIGGLVSLLTGLWRLTSSFLFSITNYPYVRELFTLITIATGIVLVITIIETLTGQGRAP